MIMIEPENWGMPLIITVEDFSRQARFDRQWHAYKKAFIDSFIKKENKEMGNSNYTYWMPSADQMCFNKYCEQDIASISKMCQKKDPYLIPGIAKVIYNPPATIILWTDKTKTVVKCCENDIYDLEKGFAMAVIKKLCGNDSALFHKLFKTWCLESKDNPDIQLPEINIEDIGNRINDAFNKVFRYFK